MSEIILKPGEVFEHSHSMRSYTKLLEGEGILRLGGSEKKLLIGEPVLIPPGVAHTLINLSNIDLRVECGHGQG